MRRIICLAAAVGASALFPASANAEVTMFTEGSGWIIGIGGGKSTFDISGELLPTGEINGNLLFVDHSVDLRVKSTSLDFLSSGCASEFLGVGDSSAGPVNFTVTVQDNDEPGTTDTFTILVVSSGGAVVYANGGTLQGGNVEVHSPTCP